MKNNKDDFLKIRIHKNLKRDFYNFLHNEKKNMSSTLTILIKLYIESDEIRNKVTHIEIENERKKNL